MSILKYAEQFPSPLHENSVWCIKSKCFFLFICLGPVTEYVYETTTTKRSTTPTYYYEYPEYRSTVTTTRMGKCWLFSFIFVWPYANFSFSFIAIQRKPNLNMAMFV